MRYSTWMWVTVHGKATTCVSYCGLLVVAHVVCHTNECCRHMNERLVVIPCETTAEVTLTEGYPSFTFWHYRVNRRLLVWWPETVVSSSGKVSFKKSEARVFCLFTIMSNRRHQKSGQNYRQQSIFAESASHWQNTDHTESRLRIGASKLQAI